jgi:hypothetical protein
MLRCISLSKVTWIIILGALAAYFRIVVVHETQVNRPIVADAQDYYLSAYNLSHHGIYSRSLGHFATPPAEIVPDAYRSPGLPLIIAAFMNLWPQHQKILNRVLAVNITLGICTVILTILFASSILPLPGAIAVGLLTACSPHLISMTVYMLTETPAAFFGALFLAVVALKVSENSATEINRRLFGALGTTVACLASFRPVFLAFVPVISMAFRDKSNRWRAYWWSSADCGAMAYSQFTKCSGGLPKPGAQCNVRGVLSRLYFRGKSGYFSLWRGL